MKKILLLLLCGVSALSLMSMSGCRERIASVPGIEPTSTITPIATVATFTGLYDFEGGLNGWTLGADPGFTAVNYVPASSVPGGTVPSGNYCAAVTCAITGTNNVGEFVVHPSPADLSTATTISAHVYVPGDMPAAYSVQVFILTMPGYGFKGQSASSLVLGSWNTVTLSIAGTTNIDNVGTIAVQLIKNSGADWSGTIYVDDVTVN
jgi:hypothetical protein